MSEQWLTPKEAGAILGVRGNDVRRVAGYDRMTKKPNGRSWLYEKSSVEALAEYRASGQAWQDSYRQRREQPSDAAARPALKPRRSQAGKEFLEAPGPVDMRPPWQWSANL